MNLIKQKLHESFMSVFPISAAVKQFFAFMQRASLLVMMLTSTPSQRELPVLQAQTLKTL